MENVNNKTQWDEFNETVVNIDSNGAQEKKDFKRVLQSSPLRTVNKKLNEDGTPGSSDSSYYDIPCYQINQSVRKGTTSKSEIGANELVLSPLQSPIAVVTNHHFQPPSIHSLGTITKRCKELKKSTGKCKKQPIDAFQESSKTCNIYENLCMNDQDISWVSSMASPPAEIPGSHFNTIERATFLPEDKFQNIQPRALFSPASDDNCGCSPLPMSSDSEGEAMYKTKARLSDVCATLNNLEFKSLEQESDIFDGATSPKVKSISSITETFYPTSPVFSIKPKKSMLCRKKEIIKSPVTKSALTKLTTSQFKEKQGDVSLKEINRGGILHTTSEASSDKEDEPFLDMSFTELDKVCTSLLEKKEKDNNVPGTQNLIGISESKNETDISLHMLKHTEITKKYFYPSEVNSDLHLTRMYFSSYDEIHNKNSNNHIELKDKLNRLNINQNLLKKFGSLLKQNLTGNSKNEKERSLNKLKKSISRANVNTTNEEGDHSVDAVDEEDKMLRAVEEAEKSLAAEEAQLVKMADEMESTVVPDETAEGSTLKAPHTSASDLVDISASQSCVGRNLSQVTKLSTWDSIEHMLNSAATDVMTENVASQGLGFLTASGLKTVISKEALGKAKRLMEQCELEVNQGYCDGDREKTEPTIVLDSEIKNPEKNESEKGINYEGAPLIVKEEKKIQELNMSQGVNPSWKPDEFSKVGFRTASGIKVAVSEMALARAKELMVKFDQDEISKHLNDTEGSLTFSTVATSTPKAILRFRKADIKQENITEVDNENDFTGEPVKDSTDYFISSGAETVLSGKGLLRSTRFSDKGEGEITRSHRETINSLIRNTPTTSFKKEESSLNTIVDDSDTGKRNDSCLSDISANGVALSKKTVKHSVTKGLASVSEIEHSFRPDPIRTSTPKPLPALHRKVFGIEKEQIPMEIGFSTGLGKKVQETKEALEKAKLLLASCDEGTTTRNEENTELGGKLEPLDGDRTTEGMMPKSDADALNATLGTGTDVLALSKVEDTSKNEFQIDFRTGLGQKIEVTKEALAKAKMLMKSCDEPETKYDSKKSELPMVKDKEVDINHQPFVRKAKRKFKTPERRSALGKQNDCCSTVESSSISCSRSQPRNELEVKKEISAENSSNDLKIAAEYTGGSIPPEEWDKSFTVEIIDNTTVDHVGEVVKKRKVCLDDVKAKSPGRKRTSTKRSLETDCVPNKRMKQADCACLSQTELREKRKKAREGQEKIIKEKVTVKPILGTHTKNKISQKQFSLMEAVENIHPVAPSKNEEQSFDVSDAIAYKFSGQVLYESDSLTDIIAIQLEDGFEVIPDAEDKLGVKEVERAFLAGPGIQPNLIPHGWIENHYKWIVWKLQNYEMTFPKYFGGRTLTLRNLMLQLKYRYDREIDRHERSALRKILEHDDTSAKRMVLRVCDITKVQKSEIKDYELQLTDGWYSCPARVDPPMVRLIDKGKIQVGTKLVTQGAILANCDEGISPLEMRDGVHIKLFTNSTRRIRWDAKLGFQKNPGSIRISLDSAVPEGGPISRVDVIVVRVYPTLYSERTSDGRRIVRNRRAEERVDAEYKRLLEQRMEKIYSDVRTEMKLKGKDKMEECLSQASPSMRNRDAFNKEILEKVEEKLRKDSLNRRNVSELLKAKVVDLHKPNFGRPTVLSIWNPNEDVIGLLTEGKSLTLMNVIVSNFIRASNPLQINATRQTMYKSLDRKSRYPARRLTPLDSISTGVSPVFGEIDLVGIVISVKDISHSSSVSQIVYLADLKFNFAGLSFWGSCKDNGWDNVLVRRRVVACSNLCWKVGEQANREVPVLQVKETAFFTENPRTDHLKEGVDKLKEGLPKDLNSFICECEEKLLEKLQNPSLANTSRNFEEETLCIRKQSQSECSSSNVKQPESSSSMPKQFEKVQRSGRPSNSPFRWLPYKNV